MPPDPSTAAESVTVFVNERLVRVPAAASWAEAVRAHDPALTEALGSGRAYLTDGRGIRCPATDPVVPGGILRVVVSARRRETDADA